jgi:hypothetical protein
MCSKPGKGRHNTSHHAKAIYQQFLFIVKMIYHYVRVEINSCKDVNVQLIILLQVPLNKNLLSEKMTAIRLKARD